MPEERDGEGGLPWPAAYALRSRARSKAGIAAVVVAVLAVGLWIWQPWQEEAVQTAGTTIASPAAAPALPRAGKPSVVVLPFANESPGHEGDMLALGVTSTITTALANVPDIDVIARRSALHYRNNDGNVTRIAKELNVGYVVVGTLRKANGQVRVSAELIDGTNGQVLWSEQYHRKVDDLFALEDEIALKILRHLQVQLTPERQVAVRGESTNNLEAYLLFIRAQDELRKYTKQSMVEVRILANRIEKLDPGFRPAYILEAISYIVDARFGYGNAKRSLATAGKIFNEMATVDGHVSDAERAIILTGEASIDQHAGRFEQAITSAQEAVTLAPNNADVLANFGMILYFAGEYDRSIAMFQRAMRLHPNHASWYSLYLARNFVFMGDTEAAVRTAKDGIARAENDLLRVLNKANLVFAYYEAGKQTEAETLAAEIRQTAPNFSLARFYELQPYRNVKDGRRFAEALEKSGLS